MARSVWTGALPLGGMLTLHVEAFKATEKYAGEEGLKQCCSCHHKPLSRKEVCTESGARRLTEDMRKAGEVDNTCEMVMCAEKPGGDFVPVSKGQLEAIAQAISSDELEPISCVPRADAPLHTASELWYLAPAKKVAGSEKLVEVALAYCRERDVVFMCKWASRGRQHPVAVMAVPHGGRTVLAMVKVRFAQELREPEDAMLAPGRAEVPDRALELLDAALDLPTTFKIEDLEDESVARRSEAIQAALAGAPMPTQAPTQKVSAVPDLMAALEAAAEAGSKPAKKPTKAKAGAKDKVVA